MWGDQGAQIGISLGGGEDGFSLSLTYSELLHHHDNPLFLKRSYYIGAGGSLGGSLSQYSGAGFHPDGGLHRIYAAGGGFRNSGGMSLTSGSGSLAVAQARAGYGFGLYFAEGTHRTRTFRWNW